MFAGADGRVFEGGHKCRIGSPVRSDMTCWFVSTSYRRRPIPVLSLPRSVSWPRLAVVLRSAADQDRVRRLNDRWAPEVGDPYQVTGSEDRGRVAKCLGFESNSLTANLAGVPASKRVGVPQNLGRELPSDAAAPVSAGLLPQPRRLLLHALIYAPWACTGYIDAKFRNRAPRNRSIYGDRHTFRVPTTTIRSPACNAVPCYESNQQFVR